MTDQGWDADQSAPEVTRRLIEEGSKWNEMMVDLNRWVLLNLSPIVVIFYAVYLYNLASFFRSRGTIALLGFILMTPVAIHGPFTLRSGYRNYRKNVARRNLWRSRFEILRKKEQELDRLLSGEGAN